jgi:uncharacterized membrane protein
VPYLLLKWLHVLSAIAVVGAHATYGFWVVRGSSHPEALPFILRNIKWIDERIAIPGFGGLLLTGLGMGFMARPLLAAPWFHSGLLLLVLLLLAHLFVYRPTVLRMIRLLDSEGIASPDYQAAAQREVRLGIAMTVVMIVVVYLMVVKPALWG